MTMLSSFCSLASFLLSMSAASLHAQGCPSQEPGTVLTENMISGSTASLPIQDDDRFGTDTAILSDMDGDGVNELAVGAVGADGINVSEGAIYILFLDAGGGVKRHTLLAQGQGGFPSTLRANYMLGSALANIGDLDGDGIDELAVGAQFDLPDGAVWILFLNSNGTVNRFHKIDGSNGCIPSANMGKRFGNAVTGIGDLNGDGVEDIAVGQFLDDDKGPGRGSVWILFLNMDGSVKACQEINDCTGGVGGTGFGDVLQDGDHFGAGLSWIGDLSGPDSRVLAVGGNTVDDGFSDAGAVWILFLTPTGLVRAFHRISQTTGDLLPNTLTSNAHFGGYLAGLTDLDGDCVSDLAVSSAGDNSGGPRRGAAWILFLRPDGSVRASQEISQMEGCLSTVLDDNTEFGVGISSFGDRDGDGRSDVVVGAHHRHDGGFQRGALFLLDLQGIPITEFRLGQPFAGRSGVSNTFPVCGATPGGIVNYHWALGPGDARAPGCPPGIRLGLAQARLGGSLVADPNGRGRLDRVVPIKASGRTIYLQAVDQAACSISNLVVQLFL